jgi:hypothetical protein
MIDANRLVRHDPRIATMLSGMIVARQLDAMCRSELEKFIAEDSVGQPAHKDVMEVFTGSAHAAASQPFDFVDTAAQLEGPVLKLLHRIADDKARQAEATATQELSKLDQDRLTRPVKLLGGEMARNKPIVLSGMAKQQPVLLEALVKSAVLSGASVLQFITGDASEPTDSRVRMQLEAWAGCCSSRAMFGAMAKKHLDKRYAQDHVDLVVVDDFLLACSTEVRESVDPVTKEMYYSSADFNAALKTIWAWCKCHGALLLANVPALVRPDFEELVSDSVVVWRPNVTPAGGSGLLQLSCPVGGVPLA